MGDGGMFSVQVRAIAGQLNGKANNLACLHGGHVRSLPAPEARCRRRACGGFARGPVRHPPQSVRVTPFPDLHPKCAKNVLNCSKLATDLQSVNITATLSYITPNLGHDGQTVPAWRRARQSLRGDGHDSPCVETGTTVPAWTGPPAASVRRMNG